MPIHYFAIAFLVLLLIAGYLFLSHSIQQRRIRRQRLVTALRARRNSFIDLATGFPKGFLPQDLNSFLYRSLIDTYEQLSRLEPEDPQHTEQMVFYTAQLNAQLSSEYPPRARLENPKQIKEARLLLQELYKFIQQQVALKLVNAIQANAYIDQIKRLALQMTVDNHLVNARQSQQIGKIRLAIHYYTLARKLLLSENSSHFYDKQIGQLDSVIKNLEEKAQSNTAPQPTQASASQSTAESNKEWDKFNEPKESWKKKNLYD